MKLKVGLVDTDVIYVDRFLKNIQLKYPGEIELHVYTSTEESYEGLENVYFDVLLIAEEIKFNYEILPKGIAVIILSQKDNVVEIDGIPAVSKYHRKLDEIYDEILAAYAAISQQGNEKKKLQDVSITLITSAQGGCGTSTVAAAYALRKANQGSNILYLPLDLFGDTSFYFSGDGKRSFTDVINAVKKGIKLEPAIKSALKRDSSGVAFFDMCRNSYDMVEFHDDELITLIKALLEQPFDDIVISYSSEFDDRLIFLMTEYCAQVIYVNDGTRIGNAKFEKFCEAIRIIEQKKEIHILNKMKLLYNNFSSERGIQLEETAVPLIGGIHRIIVNDEKILAEKIAGINTINW